MEAKFVLLLLGLVITGHSKSRATKRECNDKELVQAHVVFRHGERTTYQFYPNDPHINNTFHPIGLGGLTNNGKLGEYRLGQFLRKEYDSLLGENYVPKVIDVRSTNTIRTIQSAQLVLAGMYPPSIEQQWHPELRWQPIPVFSKLKPEEDLMHPEACPKKLAYYDNLPNQGSIYKTFIKPYEKLFKFVEEKSGMKITSPHDLLEFYFIVNTEEDMHLSIPSWVRQVYPDQIYPVASLTYSYLNMDNEIKKINAGYLMKKILKNSVQLTEGKRDNVRKVYLYSGHESTLGYLLVALDVFKPHIPSYGSAIMFELYKDSWQEYFIKVKYRDSPVAASAIDFILPGCNGRTYCPLKKFAELQNHYLPTLSITEACKLDKHNSI